MAQMVGEGLIFCGSGGVCAALHKSAEKMSAADRATYRVVAHTSAAAAHQYFDGYLHEPYWMVTKWRSQTGFP